ncbi:hypothetical protein, partial [Helicobacter sp. T3_23-1056]
MYKKKIQNIEKLLQDPSQSWLHSSLKAELERLYALQAEYEKAPQPTLPKEYEAILQAQKEIEQNARQMRMFEGVANQQGNYQYFKQLYDFYCAEQAKLFEKINNLQTPTPPPPTKITGKSLLVCEIVLKNIQSLQNILAHDTANHASAFARNDKNTQTPRH